MSWPAVAYLSLHTAGVAWLFLSWRAYVITGRKILRDSPTKPGLLQTYERNQQAVRKSRQRFLFNLSVEALNLGLLYAGGFLS